MCDPVTATMAGMMAAGTAMQIEGQGQAQNAQNAVTREHIARQEAFGDRDIRVARNDIGEQEGFRGQAFGSAARGRAGWARPAMDAAVAAAAADRGGAYRAAGALPTTALPGQGQAPALVREYLAGRRALEQGRVDARSDALAQQGGWADALFGANLTQRRAGQDIGFVSNAARGASSLNAQERGVIDSNARRFQAVYQPQLDAAGTRGAGLRAAGDMFVAAGRMAPGAAGAWNGLFTPAAGAGATVGSSGLQFGTGKIAGATGAMKW